MPGRIQKKFIQISSIILCAVIVLLLVGLNVWHQAYVDSKQEQILDLIATYGGAPEMSRHVEGSERAARLEETTGLTPYQALLTSLYFTADTNPTGVTAVDLTGSEDLRTAEAMEIAEAARMEGTLSGQIAQFRYVRTRDAVGDAHYVFLNVSQYMIQSVQLGSASFGLGCLAIAAVMGYVWYGALKWIRPLERRTEDSARLMENVSEALRQDEKGDIERAAEELSAGAAVLDGASSQLEVVSLSETLTRVCREVGPSIEKRGGHTFVRTRARHRRCAGSCCGRRSARCAMTARSTQIFCPTDGKWDSSCAVPTGRGRKTASRRGTGWARSSSLQETTMEPPHLRRSRRTRSATRSGSGQRTTRVGDNKSGRMDPFLEETTRVLHQSYLCILLPDCSAGMVLHMAGIRPRSIRVYPDHHAGGQRCACTLGHDPS